jgi:hypothetical protein
MYLMKASCVHMASHRLWFWPQSLVLAIGLVLAKGLVLAVGSGSGHRVWFWLQGLVLAEVFYIFYKLLILVIIHIKSIYIYIKTITYN